MMQPEMTQIIKQCARAHGVDGAQIRMTLGLPQLTYGGKLLEDYFLEDEKLFAKFLLLYG